MTPILILNVILGGGAQPFMHKTIGELPVPTDMSGILVGPSKDIAH